MKISNIQLGLILPLVAREAQAHPDEPEWDELVNRLVEMASHRHLDRLVRSVRPDAPLHVTEAERSHPLL